MFPVTCMHLSIVKEHDKMEVMKQPSKHKDLLADSSLSVDCGFAMNKRGK